MSTQDWVACFDKAVEHAFIHGTGFVRVTTNGPGGLQLSVVDPKDYRYIMEDPPAHEWQGLTEDERTEIRSKVQVYTSMDNIQYGLAIQRATETKLKEKNT